MRGPHRPALEALGLRPQALDRLEAYLDLLAAWSLRVNLTGARTPDERVAVLVAPVVDLAGRLEPGGLLDVGAGNGSPGLVLALLRPEVGATLLEPRLRRWAFLREAARTSGRPDVHVVRGRHDTYSGPPVRNLTLRALGLSLAEIASLVEVGGQALVLGREPAPCPAFRREGLLEGPLPIRVFRRVGRPGGGDVSDVSRET